MQNMQTPTLRTRGITFLSKAGSGWQNMHEYENLKMAAF